MECNKNRHIWIMNHYAGNMFFDQGGRHYSFAKYLKRFGNEPVIFCCNAVHNGTGLFFQDDSMWHVHMAEKIQVPFVFVKGRSYVGNGIKRVLNMIDFYRNVKTAAKEYAKEFGIPDIIYASSVHPLTLVAGIRLAKLFHVKCICEVRDLWPETLVAYGLIKRNSIITKLLYAGEKWIYKKADKIVMTWAGGYDYIKDKGWDKQINHDKVVYVSNGVDIEDFNNNIKCYPYSNFRLHDNTIMTFVYAGSIRKVNDLSVLIKAFDILKKREIKRCKLMIFGDGDERKILENEVKNKGLDTIKFMGKVSKHLIPSILVQSDVNILHNTSTSLDKYGQSQNKFFEYLASGRPILMTYSVGHSIVKNEKCGIEVEKQTPEEIANAIQSICYISRNLLNEYSMNAKKCAKNYDYKSLTKKMIDIMDFG